MLRESTVYGSGAVFSPPPDVNGSLLKRHGHFDAAEAFGNVFVADRLGDDVLLSHATGSIVKSHRRKRWADQQRRQWKTWRPVPLPAVKSPARRIWPSACTANIETLPFVIGLKF